MENGIQLTLDGILDKQFKTSMRGYNQEEVDAYLDIIIQDYEAFQTEIQYLRQQNEKLKKQTQTNRERTSQPNHQMNYDVLKRLSNLEKAVFGNRS